MADEIAAGALRTFYESVLSPAPDSRVPKRRVDAAKALKGASQALDGQRDAHATLSEQLRTVEREIATLREEMASAATSADAEAKLAELSDKIIEQRHLRVALLGADLARRLADTVVQVTNAGLAAVDRALREAERGLADAGALEQRLAGWDRALGEPPLATLPADAAAALGSETFAAATARVEGDIAVPELRARALARMAEAGAQLGAAGDMRTHAIALREGHLEDGSGTAAAVKVAWARLQRAIEPLRDYVLLGRQRLDLALARLAAVVASPPLTAAQAERIQNQDLVAQAKAAAELEQARDEAAAAVAAKLAEIGRRRLELQADDIDADLDADPDIVELTDALDDLNEALAAKETALTAQHRRVLDQWEAAVPDPIWANLAEFEQARRTLEALRDADPGALRTAVDDAVDELVGALEDDDDAVRVNLLLEQTVAIRAAGVAALRDSESALMLAAARGDRDGALPLAPVEPEDGEEPGDGGQPENGAQPEDEEPGDGEPPGDGDDQ